MKNWYFLLFIPLSLNSQVDYDELSYLIELKQYERVETLAANYLEDNKKDLLLIEFLGDAYGYQREWDEAINQYKLLVTEDPDNANYQYKYGGALGMKSLSISKIRALGIIGDVKEAFIKAAELDPEHIEARWALVELYIQLPGIIGGNKRKALMYAEELAILSEVDGFLSKGYVYEQTNDAKLAEYYYKKAIDVGGSVTCYQKLSDLYERENQPEKAISNIEASHDIHARNTSHYQIGRISVQYNVQFEKGETCLLKYIDSYSTRDAVPLEWAYVRLAQINKIKKNKEKALEWINMAISTKPDFKEALAEREIIEAL